ncbi:Uncharacterized protein probably involved in trehalose biosynthesis-like protein [Staphylothermus marinus F1]|uniref:Uncharacterized protein probably involved in trehalose biosynthesis-like protein n=1 Tax=Staphylothermus marinus (strain ATCC 43588 / DSM 3639 / JCM 9404 / F1) TaxID=399550 RepID=A3DPB9_STAMF|nr:hypothetical protein [Staphylothermus marinus]ABN70479.1 Uncharacterized protein probably involved in trehalose biosynthesis-like protein [Staphylothermus marinus F1]
MINQTILASKLEKFLPNIRWWPWKGVSKSIFFNYYKECDDIILSIIKANEHGFYLPLKIADTKPDLPANRYFLINNKYLYEAEFSRDYIEKLKKIEDISIREYEKLVGKVTKAYPLTLDTTNIVAIHELEYGDKVVVKSYRLIPRINMEPLILMKLAEKRFKNIPKLYQVFILKDIVVSLVVEYVKGIGDGGYPFYIAYKKLLESGKRREPLGYRLGLASKLGIIIADMHKKLNDKFSTDFFGLEKISNEDIERWIKRIDSRYKEILKILSDLESKADKKRDIRRYSFWREVLEEKAYSIIEDAKTRMELFRDSNKGRIHQDLHLAQMIYSVENEDFIITDFEGEPGRSDDERVEKEPFLRDIATMIRSFQYLAFMTYLEVKGKSIEQVAKKLLRNDVTWEWRMRHSLSMLLSYLASTQKPNIHGINTQLLIEQYNQLLMPWLVERALYEIMYEAMYRPEWIPVPLIGLLNPAIPTLPLK